MDGRSDQFSLAVLAYELFTGTKPFQGDSLPAVAHLIVYGQRPSRHPPIQRFRLHLDSTFQRAFSSLPEERFPTCSEFAAAVQAVLEKRLADRRGNRAGQGARTRTNWREILFSRQSLRYRRPGLCKLRRCSLRSWSNPSLWRLAAAPAHTAAVGSPKAVAAPSSMSSPDAATLPPPPPATSVPASNAPVIKQFRADPASIQMGSPAMLIWEATGADKVTIDHAIGKVASKGMFAVVPAISTTYDITASGSAGVTHRAISIDVRPDADSVLPSVRAKQLLSNALSKRQEGRLEEAASLLSRAAELGDTGAMVELGEIYSSGDGIAQDETKALAWFRRAAESGNTSGMVALGGVYLLGVNGDEPNEVEAARWFQKAADHDDPAALFDLAGLYEEGRGVAKNLDKAKDLYQRSARLGNHEARKRLSRRVPTTRN